MVLPMDSHQAWFAESLIWLAIVAAVLLYVLFAS